MRDNQKIIEQINKQIESLVPLSHEIKQEIRGRAGEQISKRVQDAIMLLQDARRKTEGLD